MSETKPDIGGRRLRRVTVVVRSWDGPNSRLGVEMDLNQMPWGPFDALGQQLNLLLPVFAEFQQEGPEGESEIARALRHVEHAADRCGEFAQASEDARELWLNSQHTWEWLRRHLTRLWIQAEVEGDTAALLEAWEGSPDRGKEKESGAVQDPERINEITADLPSMPGAAATLRAAVQALRATPLSAWREAVEKGDPEAPTREESIQTILGIARLLDARTRPEEIVIEVEPPDLESPGAGPEESALEPRQEAPAKEDAGIEEVSVEFAEGYDQGYRMGRKVGWALGSRPRKESQT
jgi:hypothetical protein